MNVEGAAVLFHICDKILGVFSRSIQGTILSCVCDLQDREVTFCCFDLYYKGTFLGMIFWRAHEKFASLKLHSIFCGLFVSALP